MSEIENLEIEQLMDIYNMITDKAVTLLTKL